MRVIVRVYGQLRELTPARVRQLELDLPDGVTVLEVADTLGFGDHPLEIMVNDQRAHNGIGVRDGDRVSYFPALAGG